ncbi:MAG TPA: DUF2974 domain-containing protein [Candidatus Mediterraneibacter faecavium]|uniref:DUF2974 domain-containing protein n=1 Tax=Candidatus Mediterraneibacter faecavium TaxID=2838668 RepID=A0A9D2TLA3_9FIRM|nr:DUF2974 domain-containing protein [Candidatus Mediterraneibacter faecavium]
MYLTDEQLMLLEQLTYLTDDVADAAGVLLGPYDSVEDLLQQFDEEALQKLEDSGKTFNYTGAEKWAAIIRQIKNDADLYSLDIVDKDDSVPALCFNDPDDPGHAVVVFEGTSGQDEWIDNAIGLGVSDTERQKDALDYIEDLPYDDITVAGHSKGGNKAQYVTILSDKIDRCVSMDGQGFSQEFLDKYYAEIQEKGHCIKNYYLDGDFVNILMFPVPGSDQICIAGDRSVVGPANHCPSSFYQFLRDEEGHWYIDSDENGDTILIPGTREEVMVYLHEFTTFIINVMPEDERERAGDYIGHILALAFVPDAHLDVDGKVYTPDDLVEYLLSDPDMLSKVLAYFVRYVETYNPSEDEIRSLAEVFGMTELLGEIEDVAEEHDSSLAQMISDAGGLLNLIIDQIRDGENDPIIGVLLWLANGWLSEKLGTEVDLPALWKKLEAEYQSIPEFDAETARQDAACKEGKIRDFSERTYGILMSAIAAVEEDTYGSVSGWTQYAGEAWYDSLFIPNAIGGINAYFERVSEISRICRSSVDRIYGQADEADRRNAGRLRQSTEGLKALRQKIEQKTAELGG